jgi:DNA-binding MarR family transcriptional regulator
MNNLCVLRDIYRVLGEFEVEFQNRHHLCLNEGMIICSLRNEKLSSGQIAELLNLTCSNTSKLLRSVEEKGLIERDLGKKDKRQMYFTLTKKGHERLRLIEKDDMELPEILSKLIN